MLKKGENKMKNLGKSTLLNDNYEPQGGCNCGASCSCTCSGKIAKVNTGLKKGVKNVPAEKYRSPGEFPSV